MNFSCSDFGGYWADSRFQILSLFGFLFRDGISIGPVLCWLGKATALHMCKPRARVSLWRKCLRHLFTGYLSFFCWRRGVGGSVMCGGGYVQRFHITLCPNLFSVTALSVTCDCLTCETYLHVPHTGMMALHLLLLYETICERLRELPPCV